MDKRRRPGGGSGEFLLGFLFACVLLAVAALLYFKLGTPPVAVADGKLPFEKLLLRRPVNQRIDHELTGPPFGSGADVFLAGAQIYRAQCASCHGTPGHDSPFAGSMYPRCPQLWRRGGPENVMGVTTTETGRTYWRIANGIRLTGMPAYSNLLTETEIWQVTLLLKHAGDELPAPVTAILKE